jgi:hypothetical protein
VLLCFGAGGASAQVRGQRHEQFVNGTRLNVKEFRKQGAELLGDLAHHGLRGKSLVSHALQQQSFVPFLLRRECMRLVSLTFVCPSQSSVSIKLLLRPPLDGSLKRIESSMLKCSGESFQSMPKYVVYSERTVGYS